MMNWDDLRIFLALTRHRTLAAAAKVLHITQSTVGRRLASLQSNVGVRLLMRSADGYTLTMAGQSILEHVEQVESGVLSVQRAVGGHDAHLAGQVRVSSSQLITDYLLAACFADLHARNPSILIELLPPLQDAALTAHEVDIIVQLRPFTHQDLVVRKIGAVAFGLYACVAYLARRGFPDTEDGCIGHQLITSLDDEELTAQASWLSKYAARGETVMRSDSYETQHRVASCGGGLAVLPRFRADAQPVLRRLATHVPIPSAEIWLAVHRDNRDVSRIRAVLDGIAAAIRDQSSALCPNDGTIPI